MISLVAVALIGAASACAQTQEQQLPIYPRAVQGGAAPAGINARSPRATPDQRALPINLATALRLAGSRPIDVQLAGERIRGAAAALSQARALWLPSVTLGADYNRHDGPQQSHTGVVDDSSHSSTMFGMGSGMGNSAIMSFNDAIFTPLAARQSLRARAADLQAATNDTILAVTDSYFNVEQAVGELDAALTMSRRTEDLAGRVRELAAGLVPPLEVTRVDAELARQDEATVQSQEHWEVSSAELTRLLRLNATSQIEPLEPPHLQVMLVDTRQSVDNLVVAGLSNRPELASYRAQVQVTLTLLRQEKCRPLVPSLLLRGASTPVTGTLGAGLFAGGTNGGGGSYGMREDIDVQLLWQLDNLGFGNRAKIRGRESEYRAMTLELFRVQDRVASEVARAYSQATRSAQRARIAKREAQVAFESYEKNLVGLGQTRRVGELVQTIVRPQEVLVALQTLAQAYVNYYTAVADSNRAQFRLYVAIGAPAHLLGADGSLGCETPPAVIPPPTHPVPQRGTGLTPLPTSAPLVNPSQEPPPIPSVRGTPSGETPPWAAPAPPGAPPAGVQPAAASSR